MSKLDQILAFAEEIESRSNRLADATSTSIDLISHISYVNQQLLRNDHDIDEIRHLMDINQSCLIQLNALNERTFYLESNLPINDYITNQTSFENLNSEYNHILLKLEVNNHVTKEFEEDEAIQHDLQQLNIDDSYIDGDSDDEEYEYEDEEEEKEDYFNEEESTSSTLEPPDLKKMISISNLQLKPMRCALSSSTTAPPLQPRSIQKKKSRYRLSSIYNINPVALEENAILHSNTTSSFASSSSSPPSEDSDRMMKNSLSQSFDTIESHFSNHTPLNKQDNLYDVFSKEAEDEVTEILPNPSPASTTLHKHARSNSLPTSSTKSIDQADLFKELDYQDDYLRFNRLRHFISISNLPKRTKIGTTEEEVGDDLFYQEFEKSLTPQQCLDNCDVCSVISDISYYSPEKQQDSHGEENINNLEFDTYSSFLRKSKLNLNEAYHNAFPHLYRPRQENNEPSNKNDPQQQQQQQQHPHAQESHVSHNFKNPITTIGSTISHAVSPTLDTAFEQQYPVSATQSSDKLSSRKLLTQVISRSPATVNRNAFATPSTLPRQAPSLFTSSPPLPIKRNTPSSSKMNSVVTKSSPSTATSPSLPTFGSSSSSSSSPSFTHNLINFMSISKMHRHRQPHQQQGFHLLYNDNPFAPSVVSTKPPTPEKIRQLKKQKRLKRYVPILIPNEAQLKRIPPQLGGASGNSGNCASGNSLRNDGSFSKLTILRNQKYINHGDSSVFNNPIIRGCNQDAIREALSASLLE